MKWLVLPLVALAGALNAVQSGTNSQLAKSLGQPWWAAVSVYTVGLFATGTALGVATLFGAAEWPGLGKVAAAPWWAWTGGFMGATYLMATLFFADRLGAAVFSGATVTTTAVTALVVTSLALDHYRLVGFKEHTFNPGRGIGAAPMIAGLGLIAKF